MTTTYIPQPGTIAARVLAWFADQAPEAEVTTAILAEAMGQPMAFIVTALEPAFEHGLIAREKRDGRMFWSVGRAQMRTLAGPPAVCADDDDIDDAPFVRRVIPATSAGGVSLVDRPAWSPPKETAMTAPTPTPPQAKKARAAPVEFDPLAIELKQRPLPPAITGAGSRYQALLERMKAGDSIDVAPSIAKGLVSAAKKAKVKLATRVLSETTTGVWRL